MEMITFLLQNVSLDVGIFFWGRRYLVANLEKKQTGRDCVGVRFSGSGASRPLNSSLTTKALDSRVSLALQVLALISGDSWEKVQGGMLIKFGPKYPNMGKFIKCCFHIICLHDTLLKRY